MNILLNIHDPRLIEDISNELQVAPAVIEKDWHVTQVLHALSDIEDEHFRLIFQGGTCLAKAYQVIQRMSEDCDFRIELKTGTSTFSTEAYRRYLRNFRRHIVASLTHKNFTVQENQVKARNAGQFISMFLSYKTLFSAFTPLRPEIKLEFIAIGSQLPPEEKPISSLIHQALKGKVPHAEKNLLCLPISETAAEKWVALTRRVANIARGYRAHDHTLVRHLYDLFVLGKSKHLSQEFYKLIPDTVTRDRTQYKSHSLEYAQDPWREIKFSLEHLKTNKQWEKDWLEFLQAMVFGNPNIAYEEAIEHLETVSKKIFAKVNTN